MTGVQTCALPISSFVQSEEDSSGAGEDVEESGGGGGGGNFVSDVIGGAADALGGLF